MSLRTFRVNACHRILWCDKKGNAIKVRRNLDRIWMHIINLALFLFYKTFPRWNGYISVFNRFIYQLWKKYYVLKLARRVLVLYIFWLTKFYDIDFFAFFIGNDINKARFTIFVYWINQKVEMYLSQFQRHQLERWTEKRTKVQVIKTNATHTHLLKTTNYHCTQGYAIE